MGGIVYLVKFLNLLAWQTLIVQITVGICIYIGLAKIFKIESFEYLVRSIIELMNEKKMNRMREG